MAAGFTVAFEATFPEDLAAGLAFDVDFVGAGVVFAVFAAVFTALGAAFLAGAAFADVAFAGLAAVFALEAGVAFASDFGDDFGTADFKVVPLAGAVFAGALGLVEVAFSAPAAFAGELLAAAGFLDEAAAFADTALDLLAAMG